MWKLKHSKPHDGVDWKRGEKWKETKTKITDSIIEWFEMKWKPFKKGHPSTYLYCNWINGVRRGRVAKFNLSTDDRHTLTGNPHTRIPGTHYALRNGYIFNRLLSPVSILNWWIIYVYCIWQNVNWMFNWIITVRSIYVAIFFFVWFFFVRSFVWFASNCGGSLRRIGGCLFTVARPHEQQKQRNENKTKQKKKMLKNKFRWNKSWFDSKIQLESF